ncbi:hypothetical protein [Nocardia otitidiscaviarum]|uniref:hypothetical protein n=1 Tax=Nocardia otitidiscaviarum TaxID=1823 RepID=UPI0018939077|nr:hypothetical protein [Nocardia otitidiscaviarum]MBF6179635.1 hypothetical protein [Nocardia otitidiscaviarum]
MSDATLNPTVLDVLRTSPVGSMLDRPVADVLRDLGIPQLPQLPQLPAMPEITLPSIDPTVLIQPVVELLSGFGSGSLGGGGFDPTDLFSLVTNALGSANDTTMQALNQVSAGWQSEAAVKAKQKSLSVVDDTGRVQAQGFQQKAILLDAERVVAQGYAELSGVIAKFVAEVIAGAPFFVTPPGFPVLLGLASQVVGEATIIAAKTRGELSVKTAQIVGAGMKIPVTGAPTVADAVQLANMVAQSVQPLAQPAAQLATKVAEKGGEVVSSGAQVISKATDTGQQLLSGLTPTTTPTNPSKTTDSPTTDGLGDDPSGKIDADDSTPGGSIIGGGGVPMSPTSPSNTPLTRTSFGEPTGSGAPARTSTGTTTQTGRMSTSPMMSGMGGGAGAANRAGAADETASNDRSNLVTGVNGDEVVGVVEGVSTPVIGGVAPIEEPPDKALTL